MKFKNLRKQQIIQGFTPNIIKGGMPIGTVSKGYRKVADTGGKGDWIKEEDYQKAKVISQPTKEQKDKLLPQILHTKFSSEAEAFKALYSKALDKNTKELGEIFKNGDEFIITNNYADSQKLDKLGFEHISINSLEKKYGKNPLAETKAHYYELPSDYQGKLDTPIKINQEIEKLTESFDKGEITEVQFDSIYTKLTTWKESLEEALHDPSPKKLPNGDIYLGKTKDGSHKVKYINSKDKAKEVSYDNLEMNQTYGKDWLSELSQI